MVKAVARVAAKMRIGVCIPKKKKKKAFKYTPIPERIQQTSHCISLQRSFCPYSWLSEPCSSPPLLLSPQAGDQQPPGRKVGRGSAYRDILAC